MDAKGSQQANENAGEAENTRTGELCRVDERVLVARGHHGLDLRVVEARHAHVVACKEDDRAQTGQQRELITMTDRFDNRYGGEPAAWQIQQRKPTPRTVGKPANSVKRTATSNECRQPGQGKDAPHLVHWCASRTLFLHWSHERL